jgi:ABC-type histidine transport system ATPase subunit
MFDLNSADFKSQTVAIFNNAEAGRVENVSLTVDKKTVEDGERDPDFKITFTNETGSINMGIYYPTDMSTPSQEKLTVGKVVAITRAVMGDDFVFPEVSSSKEAVSTCMNLVKKNCDDAKVNILVTYGTIGSPKSYLGVYKNFDFIEKAGTTPSKLKLTKNPSKPQYDDLTERIMADAPAQADASTSVTSKEESWV